MKIRNIVAWLLVLTVCFSATGASAELVKANKAQSTKSSKSETVVSFGEYKPGKQFLKWNNVTSATSFTLYFYGSDSELVAHYTVDGSVMVFDLNEFKSELIDADVDWDDEYKCKISACQKSKVLSEAVLEGVILDFSKKSSQKKTTKREPSYEERTPSKKSGDDEWGEFAKDLLKESAKGAVQGWILRGILK